jgi:hypothetical protein
MALLHVRRALAVGVGLLVGIAIAPALPQDQDPSGSRSKDGTIAAILDPNAPLGVEGVRTSISAAATLSPVPLFRPQTDTASDANITGVWVRSVGIPEAFIRYSSGVEVSVRPSDFSEGFEAFYRQEISDGSPGVITQIQGVSVFVNPGHQEGNFPGADLILGKMLVEIVATDTFLRMA